MTLDIDTIREIVRSELPRAVREDAEVRRAVWQVARDEFVDKRESESRFDQLMAELRRDREEQSRKWDENQRVINQILEEIRALNRKHDSSIGALGARWGFQSEETFRNALRGILQDSFGVQVINVNEWDDTGEVFGRPDQIELDLIVLNGVLILCELKSSMSKSDMYTFDRKTRWYEKQHSRPVDRRIAISPMVDKRAQKAAQGLGIEVYSYAEDVEL